MPPRVSPTQLIVIPIPNAKLSADARAALTDKARELAAELTAAGVRTDSDLRDNYSPGWKYNYWELKVRLCRINRGIESRFKVKSQGRRFACTNSDLRLIHTGIDSSESAGMANRSNSRPAGSTATGSSRRVRVWISVLPGFTVRALPTCAHRPLHTNSDLRKLHARFMY